jgi:plasmid maintenance system antidote protein VapI
MKKYEKIYQKLSKELTDEEIAASMLIPEDLTEAEKKKSDSELSKIRFEIRQKQTEQQRIFSDLLRFKFQLENYLKIGVYNENHSFGSYLNEYIKILKKTKKELSADLGIHYTKLSRIFKDKDDPNIQLTYRLEKHSGELIPAILWWKILVKKQEYEIKKDEKTRSIEWEKVQNIVLV